ncbi:MAG TPA: NAD(P)/FAD-dependent oxidoreductase [Pyrinomonadaceae bacterium]|jgi:thioredoxin reductase|nr:NAD(P)/FAD-dependent oxidoreductase [Pyrinomonadaceae bacterium]
MYDCIIIGAGPAGLSGALFLARYRRRVLTFHHNSPRNLYSHGVHGFLGHDGILPTELLARGRDEVVKYAGLIVEGSVTKIERIGGEQFRVTTGDEATALQTFEARRLLLATGLRDLTPDCPGFREFYGGTVHHCPDCDGFEVTGKRVAVLGKGKAVVGFALNLLTWTDQLTLITDGDAGDMTEAHRAKLAQFKIPIITDKKIASLEGDKESRRIERVCFNDGSTLECDALFFNLGTEPASGLHTMLGCKLDEECGLVRVDGDQQTSVQGVYAAGDLTPNSQLAVVAAAEGAMAAIHIHKSLIPEERRV